MPETHWLMVTSQNQIKFWNNQSMEVYEVVSNYGEMDQRLLSLDWGVGSDVLKNRIPAPIILIKSSLTPPIQRKSVFYELHKYTSLDDQPIYKYNLCKYNIHF